MRRESRPPDIAASTITDGSRPRIFNSTHVVTSIRRSGCYRLERLAGRDSHPLGRRAFPRRTQEIV